MKRYRVLIPLLLLAFGLRVWQLPQLPPGLWYDEAYYAMDALSLLDGGPWPLFFPGNNGREPLFIYGQALVLWLFGPRLIAPRLAAPLLGTLTVALVYVLARRLSRGQAWSAWLPTVAAAGLAVSFWHVSMSRTGHRAILLPLVTALLLYLFWRGWQEKSWKYTALAGVMLGISQYTYLSARLLPLALGLWGLAWTALHWRERRAVGRLWAGLALVAVLAALIFAPLGLTFYRNPDLFSTRTTEVVFTPGSPAELVRHLAEAGRLFLDGSDPNWRFHLPGRPMLGWVMGLGFWPGLFVCLRRFRQGPYSFLVISLLVGWLPALLAEPPLHALRLSALLPAYFVIAALGFTEAARWLAGFSKSRTKAWPRPAVAALAALLLLETGLTVYDYFYRWAGREETYVEYNGPLVDFIGDVINRTDETAVLLPFQLYVHPTTRYLLHGHFVEQPAPANLSGPALLVTLPRNLQLLNTADLPQPPAYVWLKRDGTGPGVAYISRPARQPEQRYLNDLLADAAPEVYRSRFGQEVADLRPVDQPERLAPMFTQTAPERSVRLNWANLALLEGYDVSPAVVRPGQPVTLNLYWRSLTEHNFRYRLFLQPVDPTGRPVSQWEGEAFREDMYRWRPGQILPGTATLWIGPDTPPGPYLVRLGFFDGETGRRLPVQVSSPEGQPGETGPVPAEQVQLALFYVSPDGRDPRQPATPRQATFGDAIRLAGITLPAFDPAAGPPGGALPVTFYWQALQPGAADDTVFLQLLDAQQAVVAGWDSQPLNGLYPTGLWSPGETVVDTFHLLWPEAGLPPGTYRLITGFYQADTGQRLPATVEGQLQPDGAVELARFTVPPRS